MELVDGVASGPGFDLLVREGERARFVLVGEQHGIAENPRVVAALFRELVPAGYSKLVVETSPPMARWIDETLRTAGLEGLGALFRRPGAEPAFFGLEEEAELAAAARAAVEGPDPVLWGVDYEVAADRELLRRLEALGPPAGARSPLDALVAASREAWTRYESTRRPDLLFTFSGDPELVRAVTAAWPGRGEEARWILDTLEATLEINRLWTAGEGWRSNARRAELLRGNFLRHWRAERTAGRAPRAVVKLGASHLVRGLSANETWDLGALLPEIATAEGGHSFSLLVLAGPGAEVALFDPVTWSYRPGAPRDAYREGLEPLLAAAFADGFTLIDLRPLRPLLPSRARGEVPPWLTRVVHGFDALLVLTGSTPATPLGN